jgi:hypothetical protein
MCSLVWATRAQGGRRGHPSRITTEVLPVHKRIVMKVNILGIMGVTFLIVQGTNMEKKT